MSFELARNRDLELVRADLWQSTTLSARRACVEGRACKAGAPRISAMALKDDPGLVFYSQIADDEGYPVPTNEFFVGLYRDARLKRILKCESSMWVRPCRFILARTLKHPAPEFVAAALVRYLSGALVIRNVGAQTGYGPLLYASVLHLARARGLNGVIPSTDPFKILDKPKKIWRTFATGKEYAGKVEVRPYDGLHAEPWLNQIYTLNPGQELFAFDAMRGRAKTYWGFWQSRNLDSNLLMHPARTMAELSVQAHQAVSATAVV
jgi:hypothetical protein